MQNLRLFSASTCFLGIVESSYSQVLFTRNFHQVPNIVPWVALKVSQRIVHVALFNGVSMESPSERGQRGQKQIPIIVTVFP